MVTARALSGGAGYQLGANFPAAFSLYPSSPFRPRSFLPYPDFSLLFISDFCFSDVDGHVCDLASIIHHIRSSAF
jgi:hypothetical protein